MTAVAALDSDCAIVAHSKCGSQTIKKLARARGWPLGLPIRDLRHYGQVHLVLRHPLHRLFSAYRMFYVRPCVWYHRGHRSQLEIAQWHDHADSMQAYLDTWGMTILNDPVRMWIKWLSSDNLQSLVSTGEPHVSGYAEIYTRCVQVAPHAEFTTNLTQLLLSKGLPPNQEHVGVWPWPARTVDDFVVAAGRVPHLDADFELWNAHK